MKVTCSFLQNKKKFYLKNEIIFLLDCDEKQYQQFRLNLLANVLL